MDDLVDIIIPVWNRPFDTRACLVSLVAHTPNARLILVDNGSDRETERMLEEFAEALDVRMLLLKNRVNEGFVKAVNRGIARAESRFVVVMRNSSQVTAHWLEPLLEFAAEAPDAGIVLPVFLDDDRKKPVGEQARIFRGMELDAGDFAAMLLTHRLLENIGFFSEEMDGGFWCLKEYSRRACQAGLRTCAVAESIVHRGEEISFGSLARRADHEQRVRSAFSSAWGDERLFCLHMPKGSSLEEFARRFHLILAGARQGHRIVLLSHSAVARALVLAGYDRLHANISIIPISRLLADRSSRNVLAALAGHGLPVTLLNWEDEIPFPGGVTALPFADLERFVCTAEQQFYGRDLAGTISDVSA